MQTIQKCLNLSRPIYRALQTSSCSAQNVITKDYIVKSPLPRISFPDQNLEEYLFDGIDKWADKTAVVSVDTGRSFTFAQYHRMTESVAQAFCAKLGFRKGDVIAVLLPNVPEYLTIFTAAFRAGIVLTTINPAYTADEIARQMKDCSAKAIITLVQTYKVAQEASKKLQTNVHIPIITVKLEQSDSTPEGTINFQEFVDYNGPTTNLQSPFSDDLALLLYSSGTSGLPKGVQLCHRNIVSNLVQMHQEKHNLDTTKDHQDVIPIMAPLYHIYGIIAITFNIFSEGCQSVLMSKYRPNLYLNMLEKYPPHLLHLVPPAVLMLINNDNAKRHHLQRTRHVVSAGAPLANTDIDRFKEKFGNHINVLQYYGLTETCGATHIQHLHKDIVPGSIGWNLSLVESRVVSVDDGTTNLGPNQTGHLLIRGPTIMPGYHNNEKATKENIDKDGWFKSGDEAYYDENGMFFITDRLKEIIKVKGFQVAPAELEALIRDHPDVDDVGVTSVPHTQNGEAPKAFVVPRRGSNLKSETIVKYVQERAAKHKQITGGVVFVDAIPRNPSGKIMRKILKNLQDDNLKIKI